MSFEVVLDRTASSAGPLLAAVVARWPRHSLHDLPAAGQLWPSRSSRCDHPGWYLAGTTPGLGSHAGSHSSWLLGSAASRITKSLGSTGCSRIAPPPTPLCRPLPGGKPPFGRSVPNDRSCSALVVSHHLDGLLRHRAASIRSLPARVRCAGRSPLGQAEHTSSRAARHPGRRARHRSPSPVMPRSATWAAVSQSTGWSLRSAALSAARHCSRRSCGPLSARPLASASVVPRSATWVASRATSTHASAARWMHPLRLTSDTPLLMQQSVVGPPEPQRPDVQLGRAAKLRSTG
jgi:hypothetical protein